MIAQSVTFTAAGHLKIPCIDYKWKFALTGGFGPIAWRAEMRDFNEPFCLAGIKIPYMIAAQSSTLLVVPQFTSELKMTWWDLSIESKVFAGFC